MKVTIVAVVAPVLLLLAACTSSAVLNEDSATALLVEALRSTPYMTSVAPMLPNMSESTKDYTGASEPDTQDFLIKRLIDGGFVKQEVKVDSYPVISGSWSGKSACAPPHDARDRVKFLDFILANQSTGCFAPPLNLQLQSVANSNRVVGTSNRTSEAYYASTIEGTITPEGKLTFGRIDGPQGSKGPFTYIERGERAYLVGIWDFLFSGVASGRRTDVKTYVYAFRPDLGGSGGNVPAGKFVVGAVSNLLLTVETRATANFAWRVSLDALGQLLLGSAAPSGVGTAEFAKKPDGTWVLVPPLRF